MIELQLINKCLNDRDFSFLANNGINQDYFVTYKDEYLFIKNHFDKYQNVPDRATFAGRFPNINFFEVKENPRYLIDKAREHYKYNFFLPHLQKSAEIFSEDAEKAIEYLKTKINTVPQHFTTIGTDYVKSARDRYLTFLERKNNPKGNFIQSGFKELDMITGGFQRGEELVVLFARSGVGKCFEKGTKVLMADGSTKNVENITIGDKVQSLNRVNTVLNLHNGKTCGWRITNLNTRELQNVSIDHMMTIAQITEDGFELIDITVEDWLSWSDYKKALSRLYKPSIEYPTKHYEVSPYTYGTWVAKKLVNEIPLAYLTGDREQRLSLLWGISTEEMSFQDGKLISQIMQLCRGLGLDVIQENDSIILSVDEREHILHSFKIEPLDEVEYFGFGVDGDHRFLLADNTLTHNSWSGSKIALEIWKQGLNVGIISPEMTPKSLGYRIDTLNANLSNRGLMRGTDKVDEEEYKKYLASIQDSNAKLLIANLKDFDNNVTVSKIRNWAKAQELNAIFIDGLSYVRDERYRKGDNQTITLTNISEDLMSLSIELGIPIFVVLQANRESVKEETSDGMPELHHIRSSDGIGHNATLVISLGNDNGVLSMKIVKNRFTSVGNKLLYNWSIDRGQYEYVPNDKSGLEIDKEYIKQLEENATVDIEDIF